MPVFEIGGGGIPISKLFSGTGSYHGPRRDPWAGPSDDRTTTKMKVGNRSVDYTKIPSANSSSGCIRPNGERDGHVYVRLEGRKIQCADMAEARRVAAKYAWASDRYIEIVDRR